jgi:hypothetical protein
MKTRKTIEVREIREMVNSYIEQDITQPEKTALCVLLESILHKTGNYHGYNHNFWMRGGCDEWRRNGSPYDWQEKKIFVTGPKNDEYGRTYY